MILLIVMIVLSGLFLAVLGYGIWSDLKEISRIEQLRAERKARNKVTSFV